MSGSSSSTSGENEGHQQDPPSAEELQAHIEQTRQELAETVEALGAKLDVKTRARQHVSATRERAMGQVDLARAKALDATAQARDAATDEQGKLRPVVPVVGAVAALVVVGIVVVVARRDAR